MAARRTQRSSIVSSAETVWVARWPFDMKNPDVLSPPSYTYENSDLLAATVRLEPKGRALRIRGGPGRTPRRPLFGANRLGAASTRPGVAIKVGRSPLTPEADLSAYGWRYSRFRALPE
jgi:hypothetical protein